MNDWRDQAACLGESQRIFFDDIWPDQADDEKPNEKPDPDALVVARAYCARCPVRRECLVIEAAAERGEAAKNRYGVRAGYTPLMRRSLETRGGLPRCCGNYIDPAQYMHGRWACSICGTGGRAAPLPDGGDNWTPRHDRLAAVVVAWVVEHVTVGQQMPLPGALAAELKTGRREDMHRVYTALVADGTLKRTGKAGTSTIRYVRVGQLAARSWRPDHLPA